jgi:hypothetical protein
VNPPTNADIPEWLVEWLYPPRLFSKRWRRTLRSRQTSASGTRR